MTNDRVIAVTGATGRQGGAVVRHLLAAGWKVRALTRKPQGPSGRGLAAMGATVVGADMGQPQQLVQAFRGAYGVFSVQNPMISGLEAEVVQGKNVADAAQEAGVRHVVYGSAGLGVAGTGVGSWESKLEIEAHLRASGLPTTVLRPMAFMELMTDRGYFPPASTWHLMPTLIGADRPLLWIAVDDVGAVAAKAFSEPDRFVGAELNLVADVRSIAECRRIWQEIVGRRPRSIPMPVWMFERFVGPDLTTMWRWLRTADLDADPEETRRILPTALTVREWLVRRQR